jgi:hypothetical protein
VSYAWRYVSICHDLPQSATLQNDSISINPIRIMDCGISAVLAHNPEVGGSNPPPAISVIPEKPVTYDWLFSCAKIPNRRQGVPGACLGVPVCKVREEGGETVRFLLGSWRRPVSRPLGNNLLELGIIHIASEEIFVQVHPLDE